VDFVDNLGIMLELVPLKEHSRLLWLKQSVPVDVNVGSAGIMVIMLELALREALRT
jgi:hypothetical protein